MPIYFCNKGLGSISDYMYYPLKESVSGNLYLSINYSYLNVFTSISDDPYVYTIREQINLIQNSYLCVNEISILDALGLELNYISIESNRSYQEKFIETIYQLQEKGVLEKFEVIDSASKGRSAILLNKFIKEISLNTEYSTAYIFEKIYEFIKGLFWNTEEFFYSNLIYTAKFLERHNNLNLVINNKNDKLGSREMDSVKLIFEALNIIIDSSKNNENDVPKTRSEAKLVLQKLANTAGICVKKPHGIKNKIENMYKKNRLEFPEIFPSAQTVAKWYKS